MFDLPFNPCIVVFIFGYFLSLSKVLYVGIGLFSQQRQSFVTVFMIWSRLFWLLLLSPTTLHWPSLLYLGWSVVWVISWSISCIDVCKLLSSYSSLDHSLLYVECNLILILSKVCLRSLCIMSFPGTSMLCFTFPWLFFSSMAVMYCTLVSRVTRYIQFYRDIRETISHVMGYWERDDISQLLITVVIMCSL